MSRIRMLLVGTVAAGLLLMPVGVARADTLQSADLVASPATHTVAVGDLDATKYWLNANNGDGGTQVDNCNAFDGSPANVTINAPAAVTVSPNPFQLTNCGSANGKTVNLSSTTPGEYEITATVVDSGSPDPRSYNESPAKFTLHVTAPVDTTPPVITAPDITKEATGELTEVEFNATADDAVDGDRPVSYSDNGPFSVGVHTVTASASDLSGNSASKDFTVTITEPAPPPDTTDPVIDVPADITKEATGPDGAVVDFVVSASDETDGPVEVNCTPDSGSVFPLGETTVNCSAIDEASNEASTSFKVIVEDTTAPAITAEDIELEATGPTTPVTFNASATDLVDGDVPVSYSDSGPFSVGSHVVTVTATDAAGNSTTKDFTVKVKDTTPPELSDLPDITVEATSSAGAVASYFPATAFDLVDGSLDASVIYSQASGSVFPLGETTVNYSVSDNAGNSVAKSFKVKIVDTTAPTLNLPGPAGVSAYGWNGFFQPIDNGDVVNKAKAGQSIPVKFSLTGGSAKVTFSATATDLVDGSVSVTCDHASGSVFPYGNTTVNCSATDAHGNTAVGSFVVHVVGGNQGLQIMASGYPNYAIGTVPPADATDGVEEYATSVPGLTYDAAADQYVYVWKTDKAWAGMSGTLRVKLADGGVHTALFYFQK
jgi:hypothetical protein